MMYRLLLKVVEWMTRLAPLVVSKLMQTSVCECYVAIATGTVARVRHVLRMVRPVDCRCVHHGQDFLSGIGYDIAARGLQRFLF